MTMDGVTLHVTPRRSSLGDEVENGAAPATMASLVCHTSFGKPMSFALGNEETRIGRKEDNDIVFSCVKISKYHASVVRNSFGYWIRDLNSSNGIRVNNVQVDPQQACCLNDGDEIQIGSVTLYFQDQGHDLVAVSSSSRPSSPTINVDGLSHLAQQHIPASTSTKRLSVALTSDRNGWYNTTRSAPMIPGVELNREARLESESRRSARMSALMEKAAALSIGQASSHRHSSLFNEDVLKLVTILPSERKYEDGVTIASNVECSEAEQFDFAKGDEVLDPTVLREDYEKLRLAYELTKVAQSTDDVSLLLERTLELIFDIMPVNRGVVLLVDNHTGLLATHSVKLRPGRGNENKEILVSSTIVKRVFSSKTGLVTSDTFEDPMLGKSCSIRAGQIRSVICLPLLAHGKVLGILHLDANDRITAFSGSKELTLIKAVAAQTALAIENNILLKEVQHKAQMTQQLRRFLAPQVVERMTGKQEMIRRGGREIEGTIVFADIRGFTNLSEASAPNEVVELLNDYFERLVRIVFKYDGTIDKYIGDALMATFGTLDAEDTPDAEFRSVAAALEFLKAIDELNAARQRATPPKAPIEIGVGINTGPCVAGFIGAAQRLEYTCIGDTVNTSSRICGMAGGNQVLISETTYEKVHDRVEARFVGSQQFKGKTNEVKVYQVTDLRVRAPTNRRTVNYAAERQLF